nr:type II toxin-antitoxin system RelE/ParE family toxin [Candidatus Sigynarchaeota archaeon]
MKLELIFHPEAEREMNEAIAFYNLTMKHLGTDFLNEIEKVVKNIKDNPIAWPVIDLNVRRCLLRRFPFGVLYIVEGNRINIVAVANLKRKPGYWKKRL